MTFPSFPWPYEPCKWPPGSTRPRSLNPLRPPGALFGREVLGSATQRHLETYSVTRRRGYRATQDSVLRSRSIPGLRKLETLTPTIQIYHMSVNTTIVVFTLMWPRCIQSLNVSVFQNVCIMCAEALLDPELTHIHSPGAFGRFFLFWRLAQGHSVMRTGGAGIRVKFMWVPRSSFHVCCCFNRMNKSPLSCRLRQHRDKTGMLASILVSRDGLQVVYPPIPSGGKS